MAQPVSDGKVVIPDDRQQYLIDFFQKLDRMMTGLPIRVIVKNLQEQHAHAETDGKRLWLDWKVLRSPMTTAARLGLNYHEVAHCYYGDPRYDRDVTEMKQASNILLDCRDETLFATTYPSTIPYFVSLVQETLLKGRDLQDCGDVWPLLYGRKYLPHPARLVSAPRSNPMWLQAASVLIDQFIALPPKRKNVNEMLEITKQFHDLLQESGAPSFWYPGGGRLIRGVRKVEDDTSDYVIKKIKITIDKDRLHLSKRLKVVKRASRCTGSLSGLGAGRAAGSKRTEFDDDVEIEVVEVSSNRRDVDELRTITKHLNYNSASSEVVEVGEDVAPREDLELATEHTESRGTFGESGSFGPGGSGGASLEAVELIEDGDEDPNLVKYVWVDDPDDLGWKKGSFRLDKFKDILTTNTVKDIVRALEAEVLFDTDQLKKAGWEGCGAVTSELRNIRDRFDRELQLSARTLRRRHGIGKRGSISMKAAMKADRLPTADIFRVDTSYLSRHKLEIEVVMLMDASGSMTSSVQQAMKAQWVIGSAFERRGAKVTIIPFNNKARDPLKGRDDKFSDRIFPYCEANGGTQPQAALNMAQDIFDKCGSRFKMLFIVTDGAWNMAEWCHKLIDKMNHRSVMTTLVFMGGNERDASNMRATKYHHCKEGFRISGVGDLLPEMRKTFFKAFNKSIVRTLKRYY